VILATAAKVRPGLMYSSNTPIGCLNTVGINGVAKKNIPLLVDGINVDTREPVYWLHDGEQYIISNLASQQNLFRFLTGLSNLTGDSRYKNEAKSSIQFHFDHLVSSCGLLHWGGQQIIDLITLEPTGRKNLGRTSCRPLCTSSTSGNRTRCISVQQTPQLEEPVIPMTKEVHTWAHYGDRARNQFSPEYGEVAREGWAFWGKRVKCFPILYLFSTRPTLTPISSQLSCLRRAT
jgi:hypothetical protein